MSRIAAVFADLAERQRAALIPFITAGDPNPALTVPLMHALAKAGADVIELGVPFSDPMADGPTIQRSSERALEHRVGLRQVVAMVAEFRRDNDRTPVVLMAYGNPIEHLGYQAFCDLAAGAGVDGVLVVDYPPEESAALVTKLRERALDPIYLLAPTSPTTRIATVARVASGYIYYVSLKGVTGAAHIDLSDVAARIPLIKAQTGLPVGVGFGIRDSATAARVAKLADAVVIGSRIVQEIEMAPPDAVIERVERLIGEFRDAMDQDKAKTHELV